MYLRHDTVHYFMVYLSDYPDTFVGYNDAGALDRHPQTPAFDVVFRFDESCGRLDLYAEGPDNSGRPGDDLRATALAEDLPWTAAWGSLPTRSPEGPVVRFSTEAADGIFNVQMRTMQLSVPDKKSGRISFELLPYSDGGNIHDLIADALNQVNWRLDDLRVDQVRLKVTFLGKPRAKTVSSNISPNSCPLKDHVPEHVTIRRCLKKWQIESE